MDKRVLFLALLLSAPACGLGDTGSESVRKHFDIEVKTELSEASVRAAVVRIVSVGTEMDEVIKKLSAQGLSHPNWPENKSGNRVCFPDRTPIGCQFRSPRKDQHKNEPNWTIEFFFDSKSKLQEVEVRKWFFRQKSQWGSPDGAKRNPGSNPGQCAPHAGQLDKPCAIFGSGSDTR